MHRSWGAGNVLPLVLLALLAGACSSSGKSVSTGTTFTPITPSTSVAPSASSSPPASTTAPPCHGAPAASVGLAWLPADLPLPPGSYSVFDDSTDSSHHHAQIDVPAQVAPAVSFITTMWARQGWVLKPAPLPGEPQRYGYTRPHSNLSGVVSVMALACDQSWSLVSLSLTSH
jgi:hypothetical protein